MQTIISNRERQKQIHDLISEIGEGQPVAFEEIFAKAQEKDIIRNLIFSDLHRMKYAGNVVETRGNHHKTN